MFSSSLYLTSFWHADIWFTKDYKMFKDNSKKTQSESTFCAINHSSGIYILSSCSVSHESMPTSKDITSNITDVLHAQIVGLTIGMVPRIHNLMIGDAAPLHVVEDSASLLG